MSKSLTYLGSAAFLAAGLGLGGFFIGQTMYNSKVAMNVAEVKGLAERTVQADTAIWELTYRVTGNSSSQLKGLYKRADDDKNAILGKLKELGFSEDELQVGAVQYRVKQFRDENQKLVDEEHVLTGQITVETNQVSRIAEARRKANELIAGGIAIDSQAPTYLFTKLNEIKPAMLEEATKNARIAANEFARNAGTSVGRIRNARQGNFSITDVGSTYERTAKIDKNVRVVTTIDFFLDD